MLHKRLKWIQSYFKDLIYELVLKYVSSVQNIHIIQIGANDGKSIDLVHNIIASNSANAILVEPVLHVFEKLKETYADAGHVILMPVAVTDDPQETNKLFYYLKPRAGELYSDSYSWWGSFFKEHLEKFRVHVPNFDALIEAESIPCKTINQIYEESGWSTLNILAIDAEGYDGRIIQSLDLSKCKPDIIIFEHMHLPKTDTVHVLEKLWKHGYRTYSREFDTFCFGPSVGLLDWVPRVVKSLRPTFFNPPR